MLRPTVSVMALTFPFCAAAATCAMPDRAWDAAPSFVSPTRGPVTKKFGMVRHPILGLMKLHTGIDYEGAAGDAVVASAAGAIVEAGVRPEYGNFILIDHGNGLATAYAHLARIGVAEGACVRAGEKIAERGNTGLSAGPHLHFEVRRDGTAIDPEPLLKPAQPLVGR